MSTRRLTLVLLTFAATITTDRLLFAGGWQTDYHAAVAEAKKAKKPLLVHFYSDRCLPCMIMERRVLHQPAVMGLIKKNYVAVKLNGNFHQDLLRRFGVQVYPFDAMVDPDGKVLLVSQGGRDLQNYLSLLSSGNQRFEQQWLAKQPSEPKVVASVDPKHTNPPNNKIETPKKPSKKLLGMEGYSPVALAKSREWKEGDPKLSWEHKGIIYHMASQEELDLFKKNPDWYAPRLLGCDPVSLHEKGNALAGSVEYGAFFDGELYLFKTDANRKRFKKEPYKFVRTRHVLREDIVGGTVLR